MCHEINTCHRAFVVVIVVIAIAISHRYGELIAFAKSFEINSTEIGPVSRYVASALIDSESFLNER